MYWEKPNDVVFTKLGLSKTNSFTVQERLFSLSLFKVRSVNNCGKKSEFSDILEVNVVKPTDNKELYVKVQECGARLAFQGTGQLTVKKDIITVPLKCEERLEQYVHCFWTLAMIQEQTGSLSSSDVLIFKVRNQEKTVRVADVLASCK